jgi:hypothetical protein
LDERYEKYYQDGLAGWLYDEDGPHDGTPVVSSIDVN